jgi:hypothetical protein
MIGLAILLIVGSAAVAGLLAMRIDSRVPVLVAAHEIPVGAQITLADLATQRVASDGLEVLPASAADQLVGRYAAGTIPAGRLLDQAMFAQTGFLKDGAVAVGVSLAPGRMPASGLRAGDKVQVVDVKDGIGVVLVDNATVSSAPDSTSSSGAFGGGSAGGSGSVVATLIVPPASAPAVAASSAANRIAVVLLRRGA